MSNLFKKWLSFFETVDSTTSAIRGFLFVVGAVMMLAIGLVQWLTNLSPLQVIFLVILIICLLLIGLTYIIDWRRKKDVDSIPDLLAKWDQVVLDNIDEVNYKTSDSKVIDDLAQVLNMNISLLKSYIERKDKRLIEIELNKITQKYNNQISKNKSRDTLNNLLLTGSILNDYNVGLANITNTEPCRKLSKRIKDLQKRVPKADINARINDYMRWSEGLYSALLCTKRFTSLEGLWELIPAKVRATNNLVRGAIEDQTTLLISAVRESIEISKQKAKKDEL